MRFCDKGSFSVQSDRIYLFLSIFNETYLLINQGLGQLGLSHFYFSDEM